MNWKALCLVTMLAVLSGCASEAERREEAAALTRRVEIHTQLGATYLTRNQLDVAKQELERALELDSDFSQAHNIMALLQIRLRDDDKAEYHFRRAIGEMSDNSDARNNYAVFLCERARYDEADEQFRAALRNPMYRNPEQANLNAGICRLKKADKRAAIDYFRAALKENPRLAPALLHMARLSLEAGGALSARGFMQRFFEVSKDSPEALLLAFRIERALGAKDAQASYAVRLRGKYPESAEAKQLRTLTGK
jgi:type IV pilus assembly protein PilF